jgi:hypothetical protein
LRDNGDVQSRDCEQVQCPGLLKLLFDFIGRLVARAEHHAADEAGNFRRIFQAARQRALHPFPRKLGGTPDRVAAGMI